MEGGKLYHSDAQRITMLGWLPEMPGADAAVQLGDPEVWRAAVDSLTRRPTEPSNEEGH